MAQKKPKSYELQEAVLRLDHGRTVYSEQPIDNPRSAVQVMQQELSKYDREVLCVVNLDSKKKPLNFNIVSIGNLNQTIADIPFIVRSTLYSNADAMILLHCHPSGDPTPSFADIALTRRVIEAGRLIGVECVDHVIIGCGTDQIFSMRKQNVVDFDPAFRSISAVNILAAAENRVGEPGKEQSKMEQNMEQKKEEISIQFGKGLAKPFTGKNGREYLRIQIPNEDPSDKTPWASFVLPEQSVHENQYGKGLWAKIPADGTTTVTKPVLVGEEDGKRLWENERSTVPNRELKARVEAYKGKDRQSALDQLDQMTKKAQEQRPETPRPKAKSTGIEK